jgi:hypothetical protein
MARSEHRNRVRKKDLKSQKKSTLRGFSPQDQCSNFPPNPRTDLIFAFGARTFIFVF